MPLTFLIRALIIGFCTNMKLNFYCDCICYEDEITEKEKKGKREEETYSDKVRGFYRPPAATMVVGRRKLLALVANDRRFERSRTWFSLTAPLNILTNDIRIIKRDLYPTIFTYFTNVYAIFVERPSNSTIIVYL